MDNLPASLEAVNAEIDALRPDVGTADYWRDEAKQGRYRSLLERKGELQGAGEADENPVPLLSRADFQRAAPGGDYGLYASLQREAADVVLRVPAGERAEFAASFEVLPDAVSQAALAELSNRRGVSIDPKEEAEFGREGARVAARLSRIESALSEAEAEVLYSWLEGLSDQAFEAVKRKLAA